MATHPLPFFPRGEKFRALRTPRMLACATLLLVATQGLARDQAAQIGLQENASVDDRVKLDSNFRLKPGHPDLGEVNLVQRQPKPDTFTLSTNQLFSYTSNAFLRPTDEHGSLVWNGRLAATWVPYATRTFTPSLTFEQNFFRFDQFPGLDFDTQTITGAIKLDLTRDGRWFTSTSVSLNRLYTPRFDEGDFYKYALFSESLTYLRQLGDSPILTGTTLGGSWRLGDPSTFDRFSIFLNGAAIWSPIESVQFAVFVRPEVHLFTNHDGGVNHHGGGFYIDRDSTPTDFNLTAGIALTWTPIKSVSLSANFVWTRSWSSYHPHEYNVSTPSLGLTASIAF